MDNLSIEQRELLNMLKAFKRTCEDNNIWYSLAYGSVLGAVRHKGFIPWDHDADVYILLPDRERLRSAFISPYNDNIYFRNYEATKRCTQCHDSLYVRVNGKNVHMDIYTLVGAPSDIQKQKKFVKQCHILDRVFKSKYVNIRNCKPKNKLPVFLSKIALLPFSENTIIENIRQRESLYSFNDSEYLMNLCCYNREKCMPKEVFLDTTEAMFEDELFMIPKQYDKYLTNLYGPDYMTPKKY